MRVGFLALVALAVAGGAAFGIDLLVTGGSHTALCGVPAPLSKTGKRELAADASRIRHTVERTGGGVTGEGWDDPITERSRQLSFGPARRITNQFGSVQRGRSELTTWLLYNVRRWTTRTTPLPRGTSKSVQAASDESSRYRRGIEDGTDVVLGRAVVDGRETLHLRQVIHNPATHPLRPPGWPKDVKIPALPAHTVRIDTWVDAETYLEVRQRTVLGGLPSQSDETWLPRTRANVAQTRLAIPAGFKRQRADQSGSTTFQEVLSAKSAPVPRCRHS